MVLTELRPESWMGATCSVSRRSDRCQGANAREGTNYRTAAQQTLTPPWGRLPISLPLSSNPGPKTWHRRCQFQSWPRGVMMARTLKRSNKFYKLNFLSDTNERMNGFFEPPSYKGTSTTSGWIRPTLSNSRKLHNHSLHNNIYPPKLVGFLPLYLHQPPI